MAYQILVVDDEKLIVKGIKFSLEQDGMEVTAAYDGEEALQNIKEKNFDLVVLDVMLPKMDGLEVCQQTREFSQVPIIMVTAKGEDMDKIMGLEYGADDYITKPFNILELKARIKAILRRSVKKAPTETQEKKVLKARDLELSFDSRRVFISGKEVNLTAKEFDLLELLMENPGKVYSREKLLDTVWLILLPWLLGVGSGVVAAAATLIALVAAAVFGIGFLTVAAGFSTVILTVMGAGILVSDFWGGITVAGFAVFVFGCALIGVALSILTYGKFVPWCIRTIVKILSGLLRGGKKLYEKLR